MIAEIVRRAQAGDEQAFAALYVQYRGRVLLTCQRYQRDPHLAENLVQEVFLRVFQKLSKFRGEAAFATWLYRIAVNEALMSLRKKHPLTLDLEAEEISDGPWFGTRDGELETVPLRIALERAIEDLPPMQQRVFRLRYVDGFDIKEVALMLGCHEGNVKRTSWLARHKLVKALRSRGISRAAQVQSLLPALHDLGR